jgi:hypothetical protein
MPLPLLASAKYAQTDTHTIETRRPWEYLADPNAACSLVTSSQTYTVTSVTCSGTIELEELVDGCRDDVFTCF